MLTQEQLFQILEELKRDERVQGILLTGSYVYGTPHENSDLDIRIVTKDGSNWTDHESKKFGTLLHVYYNPSEIVRYYFELKRNVGDPANIHAWAYGEIVYDPNGIVTQLQQEARNVWKLGSATGKWKERAKYANREIITRKEKEILFE